MTWQVIYASVAGTSHLSRNIPCQDAYRFEVLADYDCIVAAVADGLGSASKSDQGAILAAETAVLAISETCLKQFPTNVELWKKILINAIQHARQALVEKSQVLQVPLRDLATTLIVVVVTPTWLSIAHIGDGVVVIQREEGKLLTISPPEQREYVGEVTPLTTPEIIEHVRFRVEPINVQCIAMMTDGLQHLSTNLATSLPYEPFFTPFFEVVCQPVDCAEASQQLSSFLASKRVCERTDDDKTLLIIGKINS